MILAVLLVLALLLALAFWLGVRRDPRWTGNAFTLAGAVACLLLALLTVALSGVEAPGGAQAGALLLAVVVLAPFLVAALIGFLLVNGFQMFRREGHSLGNLLSLIAGMGLFSVVILGLMSIFLVREAPMLLPLALLMLLGTAWAGFVFLAYLAYTWLYPRLVRRRDARYVVVHGSGLIGDQVPPLLRARVDTGIGLWRELVASDPEARLVLSGGQGADEATTEASAMARYAAGQGVPEGSMLLEDTSRTTAENLANTRPLVAEVLGPDARGLSVTSSYHVLRTAAIAREVGIDAQVVPAPVAGYFWPSAFLRELVALVRRHVVAHALVAALVVLPLPLAFVWALA